MESFWSNWSGKFYIFRLAFQQPERKDCSEKTQFDALSKTLKLLVCLPIMNVLKCRQWCFEESLSFWLTVTKFRDLFSPLANQRKHLKHADVSEQDFLKWSFICTRYSESVWPCLSTVKILWYETLIRTAAEFLRITSTFSTAAHLLPSKSPFDMKAYDRVVTKIGKLRGIVFPYFHCVSMTCLPIHASLLRDDNVTDTGTWHT